MFAFSQLMVAIAVKHFVEVERQASSAWSEKFCIGLTQVLCSAFIKPSQ
jgi:hypothetical protein